MKKKLSVWLLWPFTVFLLGVWHLLDVQASVTETGHCWLYGWYGGLFFVSLAMLIGMGTLLFGKKWEKSGDISGEPGEKNGFRKRKPETSRFVLWNCHVSWHFIYDGSGSAFGT